MTAIVISQSKASTWGITDSYMYVTFCLKQGYEDRMSRKKNEHESFEEVSGNSWISSTRFFDSFYDLYIPALEVSYFSNNHTLV